MGVVPIPGRGDDDVHAVDELRRHRDAAQLGLQLLRRGELERREGTSGIEEKALRKAQAREASND